MKSQDEFWLGMLAAMVVAWLLLGVRLAVARDGRNRRRWGVFTATAALSLALSFGPWSDAAIRGETSILPSAEHSEAWYANLLPTTKAAFPLMDLGFRPRLTFAYIRSVDPEARLPSDHVVIDEFSARGNLEKQGLEADRGSSGNPVADSSKPPANAVRIMRVEPPSVAIFMHAWHIMIAMVLGWLAGALAVGVPWLWRRWTTPSAVVEDREPFGDAWGVVQSPRVSR
jgi:hypothetical protein